MKTLFPVLAWLVWVLLLGPEFRQNQWECLLVMFAAIELVPRGLQLMGLPQREWYAALAATFCAAYFFEAYWLLALPYWLWAVWLMLREATSLLLLKKRQLPDFLRVFALGYWATGATFAVMYLAGTRPLGFDPAIVSLTAAHFHIAGFVLTVLVQRLHLEQPRPLSRLLGFAALFGMPLVAVGITLSKLGFPVLLEELAALGFVLLAIAIATLQVRLGLRLEYPTKARLLWGAGAACLFVGAFLAALYAIRFQMPIQWVHIPNMKIWHGTLNTLGFAWLSLLAWQWEKSH